MLCADSVNIARHDFAREVPPGASLSFIRLAWPESLGLVRLSHTAKPPRLGGTMKRYGHDLKREIPPSRRDRAFWRYPAVNMPLVNIARRDFAREVPPTASRLVEFDWSNLLVDRLVILAGQIDGSNRPVKATEQIDRTDRLVKWTG